MENPKNSIVVVRFVGDAAAHLTHVTCPKVTMKGVVAVVVVVIVVVVVVVVVVAVG